jgi:hypothetical protein
MVRPEGYSSVQLSYSEIMELDVDDFTEFCVKLNDRREQESLEYEKAKSK